jgi:hypothetical protein
MVGNAGPEPDKECSEVVGLYQVNIGTREELIEVDSDATEMAIDSLGVFDISAF